MSTSTLIDNLTELAYSRFASHYSKRNYLCNEPLYAQLRDKDREWWKSLIMGIKCNFKPNIEMPQEKYDPVTSATIPVTKPIEQAK